jgi:hypothetical protein
MRVQVEHLGHQVLKDDMQLLCCRGLWLMCGCRQKCEVLIDENRQLRKELQEQETEMFKVDIHSSDPAKICTSAQATVQSGN